MRPSPRPPTRLRPWRWRSFPKFVVIRFTPSSQPLRPRTARRGRGDDGDGSSGWRDKLFEGAATAFGSVVMLGMIGFAYEQCYKFMVLQKMDKAFATGYSSPEMAALLRHVSIGPEGETSEEESWIPRAEQPLIDRIVDGSEQGFYYLITGEKGTGKTSMILNAMRRIQGEGIAMLEASGDLEVFRLRLGKALNYEFHEDYIGSLFSYRGPRDTTPLLDIERSFNKMEKIALNRRLKNGKPLLLIINRAHLLHDDEEGKNLLEAVQQRAELWAASKLVTVIFLSDEYWIEERLRPSATRMRVLPIHDIPPLAVIESLRDFRARNFNEDVPYKDLVQVYNKIGGRPSFLGNVATVKNMLKACDDIVAKEKRWFLDQCWILGGDIDDHAEDHQDFSTAAMLLAKALVEKEKTMAKDGDDTPTALPAIPLHEVRQLMTRPDLIKGHDHLNIFSIDSECMVRADSMAMQNVFRQICAQEGFEELLQDTLDRLDELESLGRTRELAFKQLAKHGKLEAITIASSDAESKAAVAHKARET
ncbi:hypothetical protein B0I35DRAFT_443917 [Stachybotrys elegans]|uniref:Orc1-like AAA ATPase domain-containing protein n=1 Tax=Stachybotrys elegans TaxID=80388 RepID=A0A8K0WKI7_9HYPO|nr:hypothetical protein B0I35DRAFT_443917 [Stachybotrys elegans]